MLEIIIYVSLAIIIISLLIRYEFKKLETEIFQSIKRLGIKALGLLAIINIFNSSNDKLHDNSSNGEQEN